YFSQKTVADCHDAVGNNLSFRTKSSAIRFICKRHIGKLCRKRKKSNCSKRSNSNAYFNLYGGRHCRNCSTQSDKRKYIFALARCVSTQQRRRCADRKSTRLNS